VIQSIVWTSQLKPERIYSLRHMITIMIIMIINILYHHLYVGYSQLYSMI